MQCIRTLMVGALALTGTVFSPAHAAVKSMACGGAKTITAEAAKLSPGDVLQVSGACTENVSIPAHVHSILIQGVGGATIQAPGGTGQAFFIRGRAIRITGFTISNATEGITIVDGGFVWINGNTIENITASAIQVTDTSMARIWNNIIRNNGGFGINVARSAAATIGVISLADTTASPNQITGNSSGGINVSGSSMATILGNDISGNGGEGGVFVNRSSAADVASNNIANNAGSGVVAAHNSSIRLGDPTGNALRSLPNTGTGNAQYGATCSGGGHVRGRLGTLSGSQGGAEFSTCFGSFDP